LCVQPGEGSAGRRGGKVEKGEDGRKGRERMGGASI